ncbi:MAG TPA: AmpG family muropeptide MFS transporter [Rubricoccaceae bacterium]|nr:AmpG family muropeptide MFS transporter [Rubricoccaceae bacterium]
MEPQGPSALRVFGQRKMVALALIGFASGLPYLLTRDALQAWLTVEGVDLTTIGLLGLVAVPYTWKFVWAPVLDRYVPPFLGRRRGWLLVFQVGLAVAIAAMALQSPREATMLLAVNALLIAFLSASQDIAADAYRTDVLTARETGAGASLFVMGYRVALLVTGSFALVFADRFEWPAVYAGLGALMLLGVAATLFAPEPERAPRPPETFAAAVVGPFREFFQRLGPGLALLVLLFILLYRLSDALGQFMTVPFLLDEETGFTQTEVGAVRGGVGLVAVIVGALAGGALVARIGLNRSVWVAGVLGVVSNLGYYALALGGRDLGMMTAAVVVENFCQGLLGATFVAFLMSLCNARFTATQYALLSSAFATANTFLAAPTGRIAEVVGWPTFFLITVAAGLPGLLLIPVFAPWHGLVPRGAAIPEDNGPGGAPAGPSEG